MTVIDPAIFKAYDIRGVYGRELGEPLAHELGRAFARVLGELEHKPVTELRVGLGRDMRLTAPAMAAAYSAGIQAEGAHVLDGGMVGTEMLYFLVGSRELDGGLMCTASHNPKPYTGAKLVRRGAIALSGEEGIGDIRQLLERGLGEPPGGGSSEQVELYADFHAHVRRLVEIAPGRPLKVVLDGGNGMAGPMVGPLLADLGLELETAYWEPDGELPDHEPNPLLEQNRRFIMEEVRARGADLGIAWDGDADRCFCIDDSGRFVDGDFLTAILAESLLRRYPGATILYDVRASRAVADTVAAAGGRSLVNRVGHAFFKSRMRSEPDSVFGGEVSGHYYFRDFYCADSGTLPALLLLAELARSPRRLSEIVGAYHSRYFISGEINSEVADQQAKLEEIAARYADGRQSQLDGISVDYDEWHFNVRASNTEPLLRLCLESLVSDADMIAKRDELLALIRS